MESAPVIITDDIPGSPDDVIAIFHELDVSPTVLRPSQFIDGGVSISLRLDQSGQALRILSPQGEICLQEGQRVWLRRPVAPKMSDTRYSPAIREFIVRQFDSTMASIYSFPLIWMNEYWLANKIDQNKPFQQMLAKQSGLTTVPTLCTNNVDEFRQFVCECKQLVAVKACAGWSASVEEEDIAVGIYTNAIDKQKALSLADSVARAPLLVQPYVPKKHEIRVTVVGTQVFPCRIDSQASPIASEDWRRYDFTNVPHSRCSIPGELRRRILRFMHNAGLHFGALDFIVTPDGEYVFLEVNPSGQYGWIEGLTGMQISRAIADWLLSTESTHN